MVDRLNAKVALVVGVGSIGGCNFPLLREPQARCHARRSDMFDRTPKSSVVHGTTHPSISRWNLAICEAPRKKCANVAKMARSRP